MFQFRFSLPVTESKPAMLFLSLLLFVWSDVRAQEFVRITNAGPIVDDAFLSTGAAWNDINDDGLLDLLALGENEIHLYINNGDGSFSERTDEDFLIPQGVGNAALWTDYDNDGYQDLFISNFAATPGGQDVAPNLLFRNTGPPDFDLDPVDLGSELNASPSASWLDYDLDGDVDLFAAGASIDGLSTPDLFYRQDGNSDWTNLNFPGMIDDRPGIGTHDTWIDYDGDGDLDLYVVNWSSPNILYKSMLIETGNPNEFEKVTDSGLTTEGFVFDIGSAWADYDNDGDFDAYLAVATGGDRLYSNNGDGTFSYESESAVTNRSNVMGVWGDIDNDGDLDLYTGLNSSRLHRNNGDGTFTTIAQPEYGDLLSAIPSLQGGNFGDYDNDGNLDLYLLSYAVPSNRNGTPQQNILLRNEGGTGNHWITVKPVGAISNRSAVGAKVSAKATINGSPSWQHRNVSGGTTSFVFHGDNRAHFGLGDATSVDSLIVEWPSGIIQVVESISADTVVTIQEIVPAGFLRSNFYADTMRAVIGEDLVVNFADVSLVDQTHPVVSWAWDFDNDGAVDATERNPSWTYSSDVDSAFTVSLTVSNGLTSDELVRHDYIVFQTMPVANEPRVSRGTMLELSRNYPNPFSSSTRFTLSIPHEGYGQVNVYSLLGKRIRTLYDGRLHTGDQLFEWDGRLADGSQAPTGVYLIRALTDHGRATLSIVLSR